LYLKYKIKYANITTTNELRKIVPGCCTYHHAVSPTAGPTSLPKRFLQKGQSSDSSFNSQCLLVLFRPSSSAYVTFLVFPSLISFTSFVQNLLWKVVTALYVTNLASLPCSIVGRKSFPSRLLLIFNFSHGLFNRSSSPYSTKTFKVFLVYLTQCPISSTTKAMLPV
jgi:hypothetical protein